MACRYLSTGFFVVCGINKGCTLSNGYVGIVAQAKATADAKALVEEVNDKRRQIYANQAKQNNKSLAEIEAIAARRNIDRTESGHYVKIGGAWQKK